MNDITAIRLKIGPATFNTETGKVEQEWMGKVHQVVDRATYVGLLAFAEKLGLTFDELCAKPLNITLEISL